VLMRVLRGSGIGGLAGIPFSRALTPTATLVRPLLAIRREAIEAYLVELNQDYRSDSTNTQTNFTRNWVRGDLLPLVRDRLTGDVDQALLRLADQAGDWREALDQLVDRFTDGTIEVTPEQVTFDGVKFSRLPKIIVQEACRRAWRNAGWPEQAMGRVEWKRLAAAIVSEAIVPFVLPGNIRVRRDGASVVLSRR
ncbi:MAG: ATP-binding protein, partial [Aeoliella sp.]